jgi:endonuclease YncB( thermonuclease family)
MNEKMIKDGYAWEYTYNKTYKYQSNFKSDQDIAKDNKV